MILTKKQPKSNSGIKKGSPLFKILEGISIDEVNKARGGNSDFILSVDEKAERINEVSLPKR
jgi:hypothetical protein